MAQFIQQDFKSILNKRKFIDSWFWDRYGINPYNGCQFGCIYCDARSAKYHQPTDFENRIIVKNNVAAMLDKRISNARTFLPDVVGFSGTTDPYQPAEKKYGNTKACLEVLLKHKYPVHIVTKSTLVLRDLELLNEIGKQNWCSVSVTITSTKKDVANFLETLAPEPSKRFDAIKTIKGKYKNIQAGVLLIPVVPYLTDSDDDLTDLVKQSKENGADYLLFGGGMTMRDLQGKWYLQHLANRFPELIGKYEKLFQFNYNPESYNGTYEAGKNYSLKITSRLFELVEKYGLPFRIKRFIPEDFRKYNYIIAEQLLNLAHVDQMAGKDFANRFWAGQNIQILKESILEITKRDELKKIRNVNSDIENFIKNYIQRETGTNAK